MDKESIVWDAVRKGVANQFDGPSPDERLQTYLDEPIKIKAIIPLCYTDPVSRQEKKLGVLVVDSGKEGVPNLGGRLRISADRRTAHRAVMGRAEMIQQLMTSCHRQEAILMETAHNFRNRIAAIGGFSRQIARLAPGTELAEKAIHLHEEWNRSKPISLCSRST